MNRISTRWLSLLLVITLVLPSSLLVRNVSADPSLIVSEGFEDGIGSWTGNGAQVVVSDQAHSGEQSLLVSGRSAGYHGPSIILTNTLEKGAQYEISGYVRLAEVEDAPAQIKFTIEQQGDTLTESSDKWIQIAGYQTVTKDSWIELKGNYTYNPAASAIKLYFESESTSASFLLDDFSIKKLADGNEETEEPRDAAIPFTAVTFENQEAGGFVPRGDTELLTVTNEANHTADGAYSLKIENRTKDWHGASLRVEQYVDLGHEYKVTAWAKLISPARTQLKLSTQVGESDGASYINLASEDVTTSDNWVLLEGTYRYNSSGNEYITIYFESSAIDATFYIDDITFTPTGSGPIGIEHDLANLKDVYEDHFLIGNIVSAQDLQGMRLDLLKKHHNVVTAENAMKPDGAYNANREFDFTAEDQLVSQSKAAGLQMFGHVLVWHAQSPTWLHSEEVVNGETTTTIPLSREAAIENLRTHITTVIEHFGDDVIGWDVLNEAIIDGPPNPTDWKASLRKSGWYNAIGPDFVQITYETAREVLDENGWSDIKLYYNDYNDDNYAKATAIYHMVKELNEQYAAEHEGKVLIDGIGMQSHYGINTSPANVRRSLEMFISLGVEVSITELDIQAGQNGVITEEQAAQQAYLYAELFKLYKEHSEHIARVTFWGLEDGSSWRSASSPLIFDRSLKAKPAYYAILDPEGYIESTEPEEIEANHSTAVFGTPEVDGIADEIWNDAVEIPINRYQQAWNGATGKAKLLWDNEFLYALIQVNDSQLDKSNANVWEQDSVEVFLDQNNAKTTYYQEDDGQYRVNFDNETSFNLGSQLLLTGFDSAVFVNGTNYTVEMKIPFTSITPSNDSKIGFDVQINDAHNGVRQSVATWNDTTGRGYENPSIFGVITLKDASETGPEPTPRPGSGNSGITNETGNSVQGNTIKPQITMENQNAISNITEDDVSKAIAQAPAEANGKKTIVIQVPKQSNASSYEVKLPAQSLQNSTGLAVVVQTEHATVTVPNQLVFNQTGTLTIQTKIQDARDNRPVVTIDILANGKSILGSSLDKFSIAIPYSPTVAELSHSDAIVMYRIDSNGNKTVIPNGRYDVESKTVVAHTNEPGTFSIGVVEHTFQDLHRAPWAIQAITALYARDIVEGTTDISFSPVQAITRGEFITILVKALELKPSGSNTASFNDVQDHGNDYSELDIAQQLGIVTGFEDGSFRPDHELSRQDMMVIIARALATKGFELDSTGSLDLFSDANLIADYAKDQAIAIVSLGLINGKNGSLAPYDALSRAEAATILYRLWNLL